MNMRRGDGGLYSERIIGFASMLWGGFLGKSGKQYSKESGDVAVRQSKFGGARFQEKPLSFSIHKTVPQTNTGDQVEKTKANKWVFLKELGKTATVTSE